MSYNLQSLMLAHKNPRPFTGGEYVSYNVNVERIVNSLLQNPFRPKYNGRFESLIILFSN